MTSLLLNFFRRAVIVPIVLTVVAALGVYFVAPKLVNTKAEEAVASEDAVIDLSSYDTREYKSFSQLTEGEYVGTIECPNIGLGKTAVVYQTDKTNFIYTSSDSKEPWNNNGGAAILTTDTKSDLSKFYNAEKGDKITVDYYSNGEYTYKLDKKITGLTQKDIKNYIKPSTLVICVPYNDFTDLTYSYFYTIYIARK